MSKQLKMLSDYSERIDHPRKGDVITVRDTVYDDDGEVDYHEVMWNDSLLMVYPYEVCNVS